MRTRATGDRRQAAGGRAWMCRRLRRRRQRCPQQSLRAWWTFGTARSHHAYHHLLPSSHLKRVLAPAPHWVRGRGVGSQDQGRRVRGQAAGAPLRSPHSAKASRGGPSFAGQGRRQERISRHLCHRQPRHPHHSRRPPNLRCPPGPPQKTCSTTLGNGRHRPQRHYLLPHRCLLGHQEGAPTDHCR